MWLRRLCKISRLRRHWHRRRSVSTGNELGFHVSRNDAGIGEIRRWRARASLRSRNVSTDAEALRWRKCMWCRRRTFRRRIPVSCDEAGLHRRLVLIRRAAMVSLHRVVCNFRCRQLLAQLRILRLEKGHGCARWRCTRRPATVSLRRVVRNFRCRQLLAQLRILSLEKGHGCACWRCHGCRFGRMRSVNNHLGGSGF